MQDEPPRVEWRGVLEHTWTFHNRKTGAMNTMDIYRSRRRDQYDVSIDGLLWKKGLSATAISSYIRRKLTPHVTP
jgi:hypothetical protein